MSDQQLSKKILSYYEAFPEQERLSNAWGQLEFVRTQEIFEQRLPRPPAVILDVGGPAGRYACWLARKGYEIHLIDPVPALVRQAEEASQEQPEAPIASCRVGDARSLDFPDRVAEVVLAFGPLYHLTERDDPARGLMAPSAPIYQNTLPAQPVDATPPLNRSAGFRTPGSCGAAC